MIANPPNPNVIFLHSRGSSDLYLPAQNAELKAPYSVWGFTDLESGPSPLNSRLHTAVSNADMLFVQDHLLDPLTADAYLALCTLRLVSKSGFRTKAFTYNSVYDLRYIHPSQVRDRTLQGGWVTKRVIL